MKVTITLKPKAAEAFKPTQYEVQKEHNPHQYEISNIQRIWRNVGGELVLERGSLTFDYTTDQVLCFAVEPENMRTQTKSLAAATLAVLPDCDRCRKGDVLLPCACERWCGVDYCLSEPLPPELTEPLTV